MNTTEHGMIDEQAAQENPREPVSSKPWKGERLRKEGVRPDTNSRSIDFSFLPEVIGNALSFLCQVSSTWLRQSAMHSWCRGAFRNRRKTSGGQNIQVRVKSSPASTPDAFAVTREINDLPPQSCSPSFRQQHCPVRQEETAKNMNSNSGSGGAWASNAGPTGQGTGIFSWGASAIARSGAASAHIPQAMYALKEAKSDASNDPGNIAFRYDPLTGLPGPRRLNELYEALSFDARFRGGQMHVVVIEIGNLKQLNDLANECVEDEILVGVSGRCRACIGSRNILGRHSSEEFSVLVPGDSGAVQAVVQSLRKAFEAPFEIRENLLQVSLHVGISACPADGVQFDTLVRKAGAASRYPIEFEKDTVGFYSDSMNVDARRKMQLHIELHNALKQDEFFLQYQPQIDLATGRIAGVEALVRWNRPDEGMVLPSRFLPVAEQSGIIESIGEWILNEACKQAAYLQGNAAVPLTMSVNISAIQLRSSGFVEMVRQVLARSGLAPELLKLELTESVLLEETESTLRVLEDLKASGIKLSIDDFGVGYSSLSYLNRLAVDQLKIDQSFVHGLVPGSKNAQIVKAIIGLGHALELTVIAEGVETEGELSLLRKLGCNHVQGFYFSRPLHLVELVTLLR